MKEIIERIENKFTEANISKIDLMEYLNSLDQPFNPSLIGIRLAEKEKGFYIFKYADETTKIKIKLNYKKNIGNIEKTVYYPGGEASAYSKLNPIPNQLDGELLIKNIKVFRFI